MIGELNQKIAQQDEKIAQQDEKNLELNQKISDHRDDLSATDEELAAQAKEIAALRERDAERDAQIATLRERLQDAIARRHPRVVKQADLPEDLPCTEALGRDRGAVLEVKRRRSRRAVVI